MARTALRHPLRARFVAHLCELHGVTRERLLDIIEKRRAYRRGRRRMISNGHRHIRRVHARADTLYEGEGELHGYLRQSGLTVAAFMDLIGMARQAFARWYGHPLHPWVNTFLHHWIWAHRMAQALRERGIDPDKFRPTIPTRKMKQGRYPRKAGDVTIDASTLKDYSPWTKRSF